MSVILSHNYNKIILLLMIKNESKIIERCLKNALEHVDAVSVLDTGSTDNTVELCEQVLKESGKPFKISVEPFKNFGYNRSVSFNKAQELCQELSWDGEKTYALAVDADMVIKPSPLFKDFEMTQNGYTLIQENGIIKYYNVRLMKCGYQWKCVGGTHEYWSGDPTSKIPYDVFYIDDRNDGGCKSDKFERDIRLLTEDIQDNPKNDRAHFYLGQSLKDLGQFEEAIEMFKKRIELGGWYEENWYSYYQIGKCYNHMKDPLMMEVWMNKAFERHPKRAEPLYHLTRYFREHSEHHKAYHYYLKGKDIPYPKDDVLFIEENVYKGLFDYENTILACYINGKTRQDSLEDMVQYINKNIPHYIHNVWDNIHYYIESLTSKTYDGIYSCLSYPAYNEYNVSSCCLIPYSDDPNRRFLMNTRYVNYSIDSQGGYHMRPENSNVRTKNGFVFMNKDYHETQPLKMIQEEYVGYSKNIEGLEDVRLFRFKNRLCFTASSKNITDDDRIVIVCGDYHADTEKMNNIHVLEPPRPSHCEKNWIYVPENGLYDIPVAKDKMNFIYGWNPLEIGAIDPHTNQLEIHTTYYTPSIFSRFRGSSPLCEYNGSLWCVTHFVKYSQPRVYYHSVVQFDLNTMKPIRYSLPFCFRKTAIEYCLGFDLRNEVATFIFSENDSSPGMIQMPLNRLKMLHV